jgi:hypothetical protein
MNARPSMPATALDSKTPLNVVDLQKFPRLGETGATTEISIFSASVPEPVFA